MNYLTINGFEIGIAEHQEVDDSISEAGRGVTGNHFVNVTASKRRWTLTTGVFTRALADALKHLLRPDLNGNSFSLDSASGYSNKGVSLLTGDVTLSTAQAKFGTHSLTFGGNSPVKVLENRSLANGWTVGLWSYSSGWTHYLKRSDGEVFINGVCATGAAVPFTVDAELGELTLTEPDQYYDDIVVVPFVIPTTWAVNWDLGNPFSALPELRVDGEIVGGVEVTCIGVNPNVNHIQGDEILATVSFELVEV